MVYVNNTANPRTKKAKRQIGQITIVSYRFFFISVWEIKIGCVFYITWYSKSSMINLQNQTLTTNGTNITQLSCVFYFSGEMVKLRCIVGFFLYIYFLYFDKIELSTQTEIIVNVTIIRIQQSKLCKHDPKTYESNIQTNTQINLTKTKTKKAFL